MNDNDIVIVYSDFSLIDIDVEDNTKNMKSKNKYCKDLYDTIQETIKSEGLIWDASVVISSFMYDEDEKWYFYKREDEKWEAAPSDVKIPDRKMNHKTLDE